MKYEELQEKFRAEVKRVKSLGNPVLVSRTRRFWKDEFHAYGWQVGFRQRVRWSDGAEARLSFSDIGVNQGCTIGNALRQLGSCEFSHPAIDAIWSEIKTREAVREPYLAKVRQWRDGWFKQPVSCSIDRLSVKFHAMRRAALSDDHRPSRKMCTRLAELVCGGQVRYRDAVSQIVEAGGVFA